MASAEGMLPVRGCWCWVVFASLPPPPFVCTSCLSQVDFSATPSFGQSSWLLSRSLPSSLPLSLRPPPAPPVSRRCLSSVVEAASSNLAPVIPAVAPPLVVRISDREESVAIDVLAALSLLFSRASSPAARAAIEGVIPSAAGKLAALLRKKSIRLQVAALRALSAAVQCAPGAGEAVWSRVAERISRAIAGAGVEAMVRDTALGMVLGGAASLGAGGGRFAGELIVAVASAVVSGTHRTSVLAIEVRG